uniref:6-cysteine protein n=1 Tax=Parastrongyloides trichosuri TaxID=131310 RepID=A0A0N4Z0C6_PARTI
MNSYSRNGLLFSSFKDKRMACSIQRCELGFAFLDTKNGVKFFNTMTKPVHIELALIIRMKAPSDEIELYSIPYNINDIRITVCPYTNWVNNKSLLKFIPEPHIMNNGFFETSNDKAHIIVPIYKREKNNFFSCGKLKQYGLRVDLLVGYTLIDKKSGIEFESDINPLNDKMNCISNNNPNSLYHFGYVGKEEDDAVMDKIDLKQNESFKLYAGEKIFMYNMTNIKAMFVPKGDKRLSFEKTPIIESPLCIRRMYNKTPAVLMPTIKDSDFIQAKNDMNYIPIKREDLDNVLPIKCLSKIGTGISNTYKEYYSKVANISIIESLTNRVVRDFNFPINQMNSFGLYSCNVENETTVFEGSYITFLKIYFLPDDGLEAELKDAVEARRVYCTYTYKMIGKLFNMTIKTKENNGKDIIIDNFSTLNKVIHKGNNYIIYRGLEYPSKIIVYCEYRTKIDTTFKTIQRFMSQKDKKEEEKKPIKSSQRSYVYKENNFSMSTIFLIAFILFIFCIAIFLLIYLFTIRKQKKRELMERTSFENSEKNMKNVKNVSKSGNQTIATNKTMNLKSKKTKTTESNNSKTLNVTQKTLNATLETLKVQPRGTRIHLTTNLDAF